MERWNDGIVYNRVWQHGEDMFWYLINRTPLLPPLLPPPLLSPPRPLVHACVRGSISYLWANQKINGTKKMEPQMECGQGLVRGIYKGILLKYIINRQPRGVIKRCTVQMKSYLLWGYM